MNMTEGEGGEAKRRNVKGKAFSRLWVAGWFSGRQIVLGMITLTSVSPLPSSGKELDHTQ